MTQKQIGYPSKAPQSFHEKLFFALKINNYPNFNKYETSGLIKKKLRQISYHKKLQKEKQRDSIIQKEKEKTSNISF